MKSKRRSFGIVFVVSIVLMVVGCGNTTSSNQVERVDIKKEDKSDTKEIENYAGEDIKFDYASETQLLKQYPTFLKGEAIEFVYDFNCPQYEELLKKYPIKEIAGEGSEFERVLRLIQEYSGRLSHQSDYDNFIEDNALALLAYSLDQPEHGINCRAKGEILNEMCLALGIYSRRVSINPYSSIDLDSHVVNEIFDTQRNKWIMVDMTTNAYVVDSNDTPLSLLEIRRCGVEGTYYALVNEDGKFEAGNENGGYTNSLTYYMKNMFFFKIGLYQGFGSRGDLDEVVYFVPDGFDIKKRIISKTQYTLEILKQDPQYKDWIKECEAELNQYRKATFKVGDVQSLEENIQVMK